MHIRDPGRVLELGPRGAVALRKQVGGGGTAQPRAAPLLCGGGWICPQLSPHSVVWPSWTPGGAWGQCRSPSPSPVCVFCTHFAVGAAVSPQVSRSSYRSEVPGHLILADSMAPRSPPHTWGLGPWDQPKLSRLESPSCPADRQELQGPGWTVLFMLTHSLCPLWALHASVYPLPLARSLWILPGGQPRAGQSDPLQASAGLLPHSRRAQCWQCPGLQPAMPPGLQCHPSLM